MAESRCLVDELGLRKMDAEKVAVNMRVGRRGLERGWRGWLIFDKRDLILTLIVD